MQHDALLTSCVDWKERIVGNKSIIPYSSLYEKQAKSALAIFNDLIVVDALSSPRLGDISKPWYKTSPQLSLAPTILKRDSD